MEAPETQFQSVHVLRHTFVPSESLATRLHALTNEEPRSIAPRFLLTSTREVAVDTIAFQQYRYTHELASIQKTFQDHAGSIALASVGYKLGRSGDFSLRFSTQDPQGFEELTSPIDTLTNPVERSARGGEYYIVATIPKARLLARSALATAWSELRSSIADPETNVLYSVTPGEVSGPERFRARASVLDDTSLVS